MQRCKKGCHPPPSKAGQPPYWLCVRRAAAAAGSCSRSSSVSSRSSGGNSCRHYLLRAYVAGTCEHGKLFTYITDPRKNSKRSVLLFFHFTNEEMKLGKKSPAPGFMSSLPASGTRLLLSCRVVNTHEGHRSGKSSATQPAPCMETGEGLGRHPTRHREEPHCRWLRNRQELWFQALAPFCEGPQHPPA